MGGGRAGFGAAPARSRSGDFGGRNVRRRFAAGRPSARAVGACRRARGRQGHALRAALRPVLDGRCARRRTIPAAGTQACSAGAEPRDGRRVVIEPSDRQSCRARDCMTRVANAAVAAPATALTLAVVLIAAGVAGIGTPTHASAESPASSQSPALGTEQTAAAAAYEAALRGFKAVLAERRAQIEAKEKLPERPGQALYLARLAVMSTYKDLTDVLPARIGRPNRFGIPPAYFDADIEPLIEEYATLFRIMQAPPADAQASSTPFKDVVDLGTAIARAKGLDAATADAAGRISLGLFFAETNGNQNLGNARSNTYKGSFQTGTSEEQNGQKKWTALKPK